MLDDLHKNIVEEHLDRGERQKAIDYLMETYDGVDSFEAEKLIKVIERDTQKSETFPTDSSGQGCAGCFGALLKLASVLLMLIGLAMLVLAGGIYYIIKQENLDLVKVDAVIIELQESHLETVLPVLEYEWDEVTYVDTLENPVDKLEFVLGQEVEVSINPNHPESAYLQRGTDKSLIDLILEGEEGNINDVQLVQLFYEMINYAIIIPGLFFILLSIILWMVSNRMARKT